MQPRLRIFISSPGDVGAERRVAADVVDELAQEFSHSLSLEALLWEQEPANSVSTFQDLIEPPSQFDVVILILWSRLGTPLLPKTPLREYVGAVTGKVPVTGTEWEFEDVLRAGRERGLPAIYVFRKNEPAPIDVDNEEEQAKQIAQLKMLADFWRQHFVDEGQFRAAFYRFNTPVQFRGKLKSALREFMARRVRQNLLSSESVAAPTWLGHPYRGLESYTSFEHAAIFLRPQRADRERGRAPCGAGTQGLRIPACLRRKRLWKVVIGQSRGSYPAS